MRKIDQPAGHRANCEQISQRYLPFAKIPDRFSRIRDARFGDEDIVGIIGQQNCCTGPKFFAATPRRLVAADKRDPRQVLALTFITPAPQLECARQNSTEGILYLSSGASRKVEENADISAGGYEGMNSRWLAWTRASEWWDYKLLPPIAVAYGTAFHAGDSPIHAWLGLLVFIACVVPGAAFVSVLNDWTDLEDDAAAGKTNRLTGAGNARPAFAIIAMLIIGGGFLWLFASDTLWPASSGIAITYAVGWFAYAAYSVPPLRLKVRGVAGTLCDAIGANVVPALLAAQLTAQALGIALPAKALLLIGGWAFCFGLRGILWHQIGDMAADEASGTDTFVRRYGIERAIKLGRRIIFPAEIALLALLCLALPAVALAAALVGLALYFWLLWNKIDRFDMTFTIVKPRPRSVILMHEYYDVFWPISLLIAGVFLHIETLILLMLHLLVFPQRNWQPVAEAWKLRDPQYESRRKKERLKHRS